MLVESPVLSSPFVVVPGDSKSPFVKEAARNGSAVKTVAIANAAIKSAVAWLLEFLLV
jgi:hypothetical protein